MQYFDTRKVPNKPCKKPKKSLPATKSDKELYTEQREAAIMELRCKGWTHREIGDYLHFSPRTIQFVIMNMEEKYEALNEVHLAGLLFKKKILKLR
jgi:DNA-binding NarL/FixJ family response regulator